MTKKELNFLIQTGEGYNLEFKESYNSNLAREICAMANATGGYILIGVSDDGQIRPVNISNKLKSEIQDLVRNFDPSFLVKLEEIEGVLIINVPESQKKPHSSNGKFYMRQGANSQQLSRDEIRDFFMREGLITYDEMVNEKFNVDNDFNKIAYQRFLETTGIKTKLNYKKVLQNMSLLSSGKLKNTGVLLFCKQISKFIRGGTVTCALFMGKTKTKVIDAREFDYDLYTNYEEAFNYIKSKLNIEYIIRGGGPRKEILELPEEALKEALLNAMAHRDYFSGANVQINIYADRVVIDNPVNLASKVKVKDFYKRSYPRNILLFGLMQRMDLVEKIGSGLMRINEMMDEYLLPHPIIEISEVYFGITFYRPDLQKMTVEQRLEKYQEGEKGGEKGGEKLSENQKRIIELMKEDKKISIVEISTKINMTENNVGNNLKKLKNKKIIKRIGPDKGGHWEILKNTTRYKM